MRAARAAGLPVGLLRPVTLAPFPEAALRELAGQVDGLLVVEMNAGQMLDDVQRVVAGRCPVAFYGRLGGMLPFPEEISAELDAPRGGRLGERPARGLAGATGGAMSTQMIGEEILVAGRPAGLTAAATHYCPGCTHGTAHRLVAEVLDELGVLERSIGVASVGCAVFAYNYFACDWVQAPHGRAPAVATGVKRIHPGAVVWTYQGDGDLASIGAAEILHAAARGENLTVVFINNATYGMTGGQMAPTTLPGQKTSSSPLGRDVEQAGYPIRTVELLANLEGVAYAARRSLARPPKHPPGQKGAQDRL